MFPSNDELFNLMLLRAASGKPPVEATATGNPLVFTTDLARPLKSLLIPFTPQQSGTGDPSPENIRSILPWDGLTVFGGGKNLYKVDAISKTENGVTWTVNADGTVSVDGVAEGYTDINLGRTAVPKKATLIMSGLAESENVVYSDFYFYDANGNVVTIISGRGLKTDTVIDLSQYPTVAKIAVTVKRSSNVKTSGIIKPMLQVGTLASEFVPYTPITETDIVFPSPVYGGTLDVVSGVLTVEWAVIALNGTEANWGNYNQGTAFCVPITGMTKDIYKTVFCDRFAQIKNINSFGVYASASNDYAYFINATDIEGVTDLASWKAYLAENPMGFAYELATPVEIQLTPTQITALVGDNTIWSDADGSMTAVYLKKK